MTAAQLIKEARLDAGLTQAELARRAGTTQSAIARLEAGRANPTVRTLTRLLALLGRRLELTAPPAPPSIDPTLVRGHLRLTPAQRLRDVESLYRAAHQLAVAGERTRGELA